MFFPRAMTESEMVVPSRDLLAVTKMLSGHGIFHQADGTYLSVGRDSLDKGTDSGSANPWQVKASAYAALERRIQTILQALTMDEGESPKTEFESLVDIDKVRPDIDEIELVVKKISVQVSGEQKRVEQLEGIIRQLEPVVDIDIDISSLHKSRYLFSMLGMIPTANIDRLQTSLERIQFVFLILRQDAQKAVVWLAGTQNNADILERAARSAYLNPLSLPEGYTGAPAEIIKSIRGNIQTLQQDIAEQKTALGHLRKEHNQKLQSLLWDVRASRLMADAIMRFGHLRYTYVIVGFIPSDELDSFRQRLKQISKEALLEAFPIRRDDTKQNVPVALQNPKPFRPFQLLTTIYGRPAYGEVDPTPVMAVLFPLLFGTMFGDVGQGLVLVLLGWLLSSRKVKSLRSMAGLGSIITACGAVAAVFGLLFGSIFGYEVKLPTLWFHPIQDIMKILIITIGAGLVLLSFGFLLGIYNSGRIRDWSGMLFNHNGIAGLVLYWSLLGLVASIALPQFPVPSVVFAILAVAGGAAVMFAEVFKHLMEGHRPLIEGSIGIYVTQAFFELFETLISYLSNSLSFVRVGAFAVAHGSLSSVFFIMGEMISPGRGIGYWIVLLIGNLFIISFEGLIVGIQTMRLSYYEFFGKFFKGGGTRFEPLALRPVENK
jgi:V/A-type H+-transporting ATPase subunit I